MGETETPEMKLLRGASSYPWWLVLIQGIAALFLGIAFLAAPYYTLLLAVTFVGAYWFVSGILGLVSLSVDKSHAGWKVLTGILGIIAGIIILVYPVYSTILLPAMLVIFIGVWGLIIGGAHLAQAFGTKDWGMAVIGILAVVLGVVLVAYPLITVALLPFIFGTLGVVFGIATIALSFRLRSSVPAPA